MNARLASAALALGCALLGASCDGGGRGPASERAINVSASPVDIDFSLPEFSLVDQRGTPTTRRDLLGRVLVVDFIFTSCPTICPRLTERMALLAKRLEGHRDVLFVSITVDPENDSPEKLAAYGAKYGADPDRWRFLTGEPKHVEETVLHGFKMAVRRAGGGSIDHAEKFVLVDQRMHVVGVFESDDDGLAKLQARIGPLMAAAPASARP